MRLPWNKSKEVQLDLFGAEPGAAASHQPVAAAPRAGVSSHNAAAYSTAAAMPSGNDGGPLLLAVSLLYEDAHNPRTGFPEESIAELHEVPVVVRDLPADRYAQVAENQKRHGLTPLELARFIRAQVNADDPNATIARQLGMNLSAVAHHLSLLELPPVLDDALKSGRCTSPRTLHRALPALDPACGALATTTQRASRCSGSLAFQLRAEARKLRRILQLPDGRPMGISASDVVPFTQARATLSDLAEQVKAGAEKIITKNGESYVALIDAERLDYYHRLERERIHLLLIDDARRGLADIAAGRTQDADAGIAALQARRAGAPRAGTKGKVKASGTARKRG